MREGLLPGELVEIRVLAVRGVQTDEWGVLQGNALLWVGKQGQAGLVLRGLDRSLRRIAL